MTPSDNSPKSCELDVNKLQYELSNLSLSSTPAKTHSDGGQSSFGQAASLIASLSLERRILVESRYTDGESEMINTYLGHFCDENHTVAASLLTRSTQFNTFIASVGRKMPNEQEFGELISYIASHLEQEGTTDNKFVSMGSHILRPRVRQPGAKNPNSSPDLKPDFFTTRVVSNSSTGTYAPKSLSTLLHPLESSRNAPSMVNAPFVFANNDGIFTWDDVHTLWEIKSVVQSSVSYHKALGNIVLKASEVLRNQWQRLFVNGFLICGTQLQMLRFDRSCMLVSQPVDVQTLTSIGEGSSVLVRCILADLVTHHSAKGFVEGSDAPNIIDVDGKPRQVVQVDGKDFILGDQIAWPVRGHLSGRATTVHLARQRGDNDWGYCHKSSWPYESRQHEGSILRELQDIKGVVDVVAWSSTESNCPCSKVILSNYHPYKPPKFQSAYPPHWAITPTSQASRPSTTRQSPSAAELHMRQHRQTVTKYIPHSLADLRQPVDILQVLRSIYGVIDQVAKKGWVHRDLSWNNIRTLYNPGSKYFSVVLIDYDLTVPMERMVPVAPDKTGTPAFMLLEILLCDTAHHQELHDDEVALWAALIIAVKLSKQGFKMLIDTVFKPGTDLRSVGSYKTSMLSGSAICGDWPQWICDGSDSDDRKWEVVRKVFLSIAILLFGPQLEYDYTIMYGDRARHQKKHQEFVGEAEVLLDKAIAEVGQMDDQDLSKLRNLWRGNQTSL